jgi:hypothetical protein
MEIVKPRSIDDASRKAAPSKPFAVVRNDLEAEVLAAEMSMGMPPENPYDFDVSYAAVGSFRKNVAICLLVAAWVSALLAGHLLGFF